MDKKIKENKLTDEQKREIDKVVERVIEEYGETLRLMGREE
ncbi:MAG: hypothetical protein PHW53_04100 [Patescibacteria group bacterium]|nr:hypothetical protein [Patescibacteria group bacterium]